MEFLKGDCLEVMKTLADKSIDCFVCDLPYGCLSNKTLEFKHECPTSIKRINGCAWDIKINLDLFWTQIKRLAKNDHTPILMFCTTKFGAELIASNPSWFRYDIVWNKGNGVGFLCANKQPLRSHEMIYVFSKKGAYYKRIDIEGNFPPTNWNKEKKMIPSSVYNGGKPLPNNTTHNTTHRCVKSVVEIANKKGKGKHPTQKPAELYEWLLKRYCPEEGTILDPTAGSFTSCFTAQKLGLKSIGIEMNEEFYGKACLIKNQ
jgi:site-specific DNA-methyltransferase (adenine-specific)